MDDQLLDLKKIIREHQEIAILVVAVLFYFLVWPHIHIFSDTWRYKMTVTVETPEGIKTGSAVREVERYRVFNLTTKWGRRFRLVKGEAVIIDLGKRGNLFALLSGSVWGDYGTDVLVRNIPDFYNAKVGTIVALPLTQLPTLVYFKDLNDPMTVGLITPVGSQDITNSQGRPEKAVLNIFGAGVKISGLSIEITDEPVTGIIEAKLPWLSRLRGTYLDGRMDSARSPYGLDGSVFIRGKTR
jgi:hypothetical protein